MWVSEKVVVAHEGCDELAVDKVMGLVDGTQAPVGVVVGVGAETERAIWCGNTQDSCFMRSTVKIG